MRRAEGKARARKGPEVELDDVLEGFQGISAIERLETDLLLAAVYRVTGNDFRQYAPSSMRRRLRKRRDEEGLKTYSALQDLVLHEPGAMQRLLDDMSVSVTGMFRDPTFFSAFRKVVVPIIRTYPFTRIWHAGCATGEEVYAAAIVLEEEGLYDRARIYATDMNAGALAKAKAGIFPLARMREYTASYQAAGGQRSFSDYYTAHYDAALFDGRLRRHVHFAQHNLASDGCFSEFNVILCRNVLIYFSRPLKDRVLNLFSDSLSPFGLLCLGRRETLRFTAGENMFEEVDKVERIWKKLR